MKNPDMERQQIPIRRLKKLSYKHDPNLKVILKILKKVRDGKYVETIENVKEIDERIYKKHPEVLFDLWRFEVLRIASTGSHDVALELIRRHLTPIVGNHNELFLKLKV